MNLTLNFENYNRGMEDGVRVYRATTPIADASLPAPLATLPSGATQYVDDTVVRGSKYYYRFGIFKGTDEMLSPNRAVRAVSPVDTGPGPQKLAMGDWDLGYFGITRSVDFISYNNLALFLGFPTTGNAADIDWLKVAYKGKVLYISRNIIRLSVSYATLYNAGAVFGTNDNGAAVPTGSTPTNQYKPLVVKSDYTLLPRILKGVADGAVMPPPAPGLTSPALAQNEYDDIIGPFINTAKYPGDITKGIFGRNDSEMFPVTSTNYAYSDLAQQSSGFTDLTKTVMRNARIAATLPLAAGAVVPMPVSVISTATTILGGSTVNSCWRATLELVL